MDTVIAGLAELIPALLPPLETSLTPSEDDPDPPAIPVKWENIYHRPLVTGGGRCLCRFEQRVPAGQSILAQCEGPTGLWTVNPHDWSTDALGNNQLTSALPGTRKPVIDTSSNQVTYWAYNTTNQAWTQNASNATGKWQLQTIDYTQFPVATTMAMSYDPTIQEGYICGQLRTPRLVSLRDAPTLTRGFMSLSASNLVFGTCNLFNPAIPVTSNLLYINSNGLYNNGMLLNSNYGRWYVSTHDSTDPFWLPSQNTANIISLSNDTCQIIGRREFPTYNADSNICCITNHRFEGAAETLSVVNPADPYGDPLLFTATSVLSYDLAGGLRFTASNVTTGGSPLDILKVTNLGEIQVRNQVNGQTQYLFDSYGTFTRGKTNIVSEGTIKHQFEGSWQNVLSNGQVTRGTAQLSNDGTLAIGRVSGLASIDPRWPDGCLITPSGKFTLGSLQITPDGGIYLKGKLVIDTYGNLHNVTVTNKVMLKDPGWVDKASQAYANLVYT